MTHPRTSALIEHIRQRDGQVGVGLGNATEEWVTLCRELAWKAAREMPKSVSLTSPAYETSTFCGEMSQCTICSGWPSSPARSCAKARALSTSAAMNSASGMFHVAACLQRLCG